MSATCCPCRVVEFRGVEGPTTQVETSANCPCESCHEPWDKLTDALAWMHHTRTTTNTHPQGASHV